MVTHKLMATQKSNAGQPSETHSASQSSTGSGAVSTWSSLRDRVLDFETDAFIAALHEVYWKYKAGKNEPSSEKHLIWDYYAQQLIAQIKTAYASYCVYKTDLNRFPLKDSAILAAYTTYRKEGDQGKADVEEYMVTNFSDGE